MSAAGTWIVRTPEFEGPFDLLLHLIARQRVDLWQVSLARITRDYLAEVRRMRALDLQVASEFLVVAATLLELKAARLLPGDDPESEQVEALLSERDLLFARVLQYQAYKQVAGLLAERFQAQAAYRPRTAGAAEVLARVVPNLLASVTPEELAKAAARALTPVQRPSEAEHIAPPPRLSLAETVQELLGELRRMEATTFRALVGPRPLPIEVVVRFLAILELYKRSVVELEQRAAFGDIDVRWTGAEPETQATDERTELPS